MSELRQAAELALTALDATCPNTWHSVRENLRKALSQSEWVGLTDEEVWDCYSSRGDWFYKAIEAKLKEKNT